MKKFNYTEIPIKSIIKKKVKQTNPLFDLEIENNNNYVANGIVVHNSEAKPFFSRGFFLAKPDIIKILKEK